MFGFEINVSLSSSKDDFESLVGMEIGLLEDPVMPGEDILNLTPDELIPDMKLEELITDILTGEIEIETTDIVNYVL